MIIILNNISNYQNIKSVLYFKNANIIKDIDIFLKDNVKNKIKYLTNRFDIFLSQFTLMYKTEKNEKEIKLFGDKFVKNNKNNYYLIIEDKIINLCESFNLKNENKIRNLKVKLVLKSIKLGNTKK